MTGIKKLLVALLTGTTFEAPRLAGAAHIEDIARVHVLTIKESSTL